LVYRFARFAGREEDLIGGRDVNNGNEGLRANFERVSGTSNIETHGGHELFANKRVIDPLGGETNEGLIGFVLIFVQSFFDFFVDHFGVILYHEELKELKEIEGDFHWAKSHFEFKSGVGFDNCRIRINVEDS